MDCWHHPDQLGNQRNRELSRPETLEQREAEMKEKVLKLQGYMLFTIVLVLAFLALGILVPTLLIHFLSFIQ
jgi:hypothetical protein